MVCPCIYLPAFFFRKVCIICPFFFWQIANNLIRSLVMLFHLFFRPSPCKVIIGTDFNFFDFRMILQKFFQCVRWPFKTFTLYLCVFFRATIPPRERRYLSLFPSSSVMCANASIHASYTATRFVSLSGGMQKLYFFHSRSAPS